MSLSRLRKHKKWIFFVALLIACKVIPIGLTYAGMLTQVVWWGHDYDDRTSDQIGSLQFAYFVAMPPFADSLYLKSGTTLEVAYDIRGSGAWIGISGGDCAADIQRCRRDIEAPGTGTFSIPITKSGLYGLDVISWEKSYNTDYKITWLIR